MAAKAWFESGSPCADATMMPTPHGRMYDLLELNYNASHTCYLPLWNRWRHFHQLHWYDLAMGVLFAVVVTIVRDWFQAWGKRRGLAVGLPVGTAQKYSESWWKVWFYAFSMVWGNAVLWRHSSFVTDDSTMWTHLLHGHGGVVIPGDIWLYYVFQIGFYLHSLYAHLFVEVRRSDFWEMLVHHVTTIALLVGSLSCDFYPVGLLVVIVHDPSDLLFERAKLYVYTKRETLANVWFGSWVLSWVLLRLMAYPFFVIRSCAWTSIARIGPFPHHHTFMVLLSVLQVLHIIWFFMICALLYRIATGQQKKVEDSREKDD